MSQLCKQRAGGDWERGAGSSGGKAKHRREKLDTVCEKITRGTRGAAEEGRDN